MFRKVCCNAIQTELVVFFQVLKAIGNSGMHCLFFVSLVLNLVVNGNIRWLALLVLISGLRMAFKPQGRHCYKTPPA